MTTPIHIALTFDDNFWAPAYATMRSVCLSTKHRVNLVFHLLHQPLTSEHRADLERITDEFGAQLRFYSLAHSEAFQTLVAQLRVSERWPHVVYARLALAKLLPSSAGRVIYLDSDVMVRRPIEELFNIELDGKPLGAVRDALAPFISLGRDMRANAHIFDGSDPYFNSGVLVIDLEQWRTLSLEKEIEELASTGVLPHLYFDQDMLNLIFRGRWQALPWRWNTIDAHAVHEAMDPAILHYTRSPKPWAIYAGVLRSTAYARWYRHVMTNELFYRFARHRWKRWWLKKLGLAR